MKCAWQAYLNLLPHWMRKDVDTYGKDNLQELRMQIGAPPQMLLNRSNHRLSRPCVNEDIAFVINSASQYSPWTAGTLGKGFITASGGHRIGVCGEATISGDRMSGISFPTSLCVRTARDFTGIAGKAADIDGSILIIGPPGSGKTTLLRDLIRTKANTRQTRVSVVDERQEIFPLFRGQACFDTGAHTDVLSGCSKAEGIDAVLRSMNPEWIAVDEITSRTDCDALLQAGWCGVGLMATAHAGSLRDLKTRPVYRPLIDYNLFSTVLILQRDKSWTMERM